MKLLALSERTAKEILRDPLNLAFGLGFPLVLLLLFSAIQASIPESPFAIESITPGIAVFGLSFMTLFSATLVAKDRESAFLQRLYTTPLAAVDFILGYMLPILPIAAAQGILCYLTAIALGLPATGSILSALLCTVPASLFFIALGLLCGSVFNAKQAGGLCGALLTNLTAYFSGAWFDVGLIGGAFQRVANALPFLHAVELERAVLSGNRAELFSHLCWVLGYMLAAGAAAVLFFFKQMKQQ